MPTIPRINFAVAIGGALVVPVSDPRKPGDPPRNNGERVSDALDRALHRTQDDAVKSTVAFAGVLDAIVNPSLSGQPGSLQSLTAQWAQAQEDMRAMQDGVQPAGEPGGVIVVPHWNRDP